MNTALWCFSCGFIGIGGFILGRLTETHARMERDAAAAIRSADDLLLRMRENKR